MLVQTITTVEEAKAFEAEGEAVVIGLFSKTDSEQAKAFMSAASGVDRLPFAISSSKEVSSRHTTYYIFYKYRTTRSKKTRKENRPAEMYRTKIYWRTVTVEVVNGVYQFY